MLTADIPAPRSRIARGLVAGMGRGLEEIGRDLRDWVEPEPATIPAWDRMVLESRFRPPVPLLDLCLLEDGHPLGWTSVEILSDGDLRWIEPPAGPAWVRELLAQAVEEWRLQMGAP